MNEITFQKDGKIYLDSGMNESFFARSKMTNHLKEGGFLAEKDAGQNGSGWKFSEWKFEGCQEKNDVLSEGEKKTDTVLFEGRAFEGHFLCHFLEDESKKELASYACAKVISAMEDALDKKLSLKQIGAPGIFLSEDFTKIIFLPSLLFDQCAACRGDEFYSKAQGFYVNPNLSDSAGLNFEESLLTYKVLIGSFPFTQVVSYKRHEDYLDHNFIPLRNYLFHRNKDLSTFVDDALMRRQKNTSLTKSAKKTSSRTMREILAEKIQEDDKGEKSRQAKMDMAAFRLKFPLKALYEEVGLTEEGEFFEGESLLKKDENISSQEKAAFTKKCEKENAAFQKRLKIKRFFRRKKTFFTVAFFAILAVCLFTGGMVNGNMKNPTSKGLTARETVEMFLGAYNRLDIPAIQNSSKGKDSQDLVNTVTAYFVAAKQKESYNPKDSTVTPAEWLLYNRNLSYNMNGLTQLCIDGESGRIYFEGPKKNTRPESVTEENGKILLKGDSENHRATYYVLFNDGQDTLHLAKHDDSLTLTYDGKKWTVTSFAQNIEYEDMDLKVFKNDYSEAMEKAENDVLKAASLLSEKYYFINSQSEILEAEEYVKKENSFFLKED